MLTATLTAATDTLDTVTVYDDVEMETVALVQVVPLGKAADYEKTLRVAGFNPVAFDGTKWTVEKF